jgi:hypothetical protein
MAVSFSSDASIADREKGLAQIGQPFFHSVRSGAP